MEDFLKVLPEYMNKQAKLNTMLSGECWINGITKKGKKINWFRCIAQELAEAVDCFPWKHWKDVSAEVDIENLKMEMVDVFHFQLSLYSNVENINDMLSKAKIQNDNSVFSEVDSLDTLKLIEGYLTITTHAVNSTLDKEGFNHLMEFMTIQFYRVINSFDFSVEELTSLYDRKNMLNIFRMEHGYQDGTYIKIWNGVEDNSFMELLLKENPDISIEDLKAKLNSVYSEL